MADWHVDVKGLTEAEKKAARMLALSLDLRPFWPKVATIFISWMRRQFETEGRFAGPPWARLSPEYAAWKAIHYPGRGILQATGDIRRAASMPLRSATPTMLTLTIHEPGIHHGPVLQYHQEGTPRMPRRPLVFDVLPAVARAELDEAAHDYLREMALRVGFTTS